MASDDSFEIEEEYSFKRTLRRIKKDKRGWTFPLLLPLWNLCLKAWEWITKG